MADSPIPLDLGGGREIDLFLLEFDKRGRMSSPQAERTLFEALPGHSDVFFFSHGWNNTYAVAMESMGLWVG